MAKYHINPETGKPGRCRASAGKCPFAGDSLHYETVKAARAGFENTMRIFKEENYLAFDGEPLWDEGVTERLEEIYTKGDCWKLAYALHERYGYEVYTFGVSEYSWYHVAVKVDEGKFLDITGFSDEGELARRYGEIVVKVSDEHLTSVDALCKGLAAYYAFPYPQELAFEIAGLLHKNTVETDDA